MSAKIDYSSFEIKKFKDLNLGDYFLWGGQLYQKIETCYVQPQAPQDEDWCSRNAIKVVDGELVCYYEEETSFPVSVDIKVDHKHS
jgi:hypothetical protein|tara:strand:- start:274 stop:531 length:258 start_codon:yes stop_codon:yes gene_type:complete